MTKQELDHKYYLAIRDTPEYKLRRAKSQKKYRESHLDFVRRLNREWWHRRPKEIAQPKSENSPKEDKPRIYDLKHQAEYCVRVKIEVLSHYGPEGKLQCAWPECSVNDIDMLSLDHVQNDGAADRKSEDRGGGGNTTYRRVRKAGFPGGFQTLCHNHQWKKELIRRREARK